jgi:hypothetical protein
MTTADYEQHDNGQRQLGAQRVRVRGQPAMGPDDHEAWLRYRIKRLRALLRFANEPHVESGLRELIADAEERLEPLENWQGGIAQQSN